MKSRVNLVLLVVLTVVCCFGCQAGEFPQPTQVPVGGATLDWDRSRVTLPLEGYGMTQEEIQIVSAAQTLLVWLCMEDTEMPSTVALDNIHHWLSWVDGEPSWYYGYWNVNYIAVHGILAPSVSPDRGPVPDNGNAVEEWKGKRQKCLTEEAYQSISIVDTTTISGSGSDETSNLISFTFDALHASEQDAGFLALVEEKKECIHAQGYETYGTDVTPTGSVYINPSWSEGQQLKAYLVEAQCSDDLGFTQQVADINAAYEHLYIEENKAELLRIRNIAESRVSEATKILEKYDVM